MLQCLYALNLAAPCVLTHGLQAIRDRVGQMLDTAGQAGVKVACLQEAWCVGKQGCVGYA